MKQRAFRKELTNALKLWQKSGYTAESREIIRARAASRVSENHPYPLSVRWYVQHLEGLVADKLVVLALLLSVCRHAQLGARVQNRPPSGPPPAAHARFTEQVPPF